MKKLTTLLSTIGAVGFLALAIGCMTTRQTEDLLSEAGFKKVAAATPEQQAHLKTLPTHKVTTVQRDGKLYYIYPDTGHRLLYVGQHAQYQKYLDLCQQCKQAQYQTEENIMNAEAIRSTWGNWSQ
jgi:hypothetical protein